MMVAKEFLLEEGIIYYENPNGNYNAKTPYPIMNNDNNTMNVLKVMINQFN